MNSGVCCSSPRGNLLKKTILACVLMATVALQGCASYTKWKVDAVEPSRKGVVVRSVSIAPFSGEGQSIGTQFARLLAGQLEELGYVKVVRNGAEGRLVGTMDGTGSKIDTWRNDYKVDGKTHYTYYARVRKSLTASYSLSVGGETWSGTYSQEYSDTESSGDGYRSAKADLPSDDAIRNWLMKTVASRIVQDLSPYKVRKTYKLKYGDTDNLELGTEYAKLGREEQAMSIFRQITQKTKNDEDRAAALYNMGVLYEIRGDFDKAFQAYRDASQFHLEELMYPEAITRLEKEMERRAALDKQMEALAR